MIRRPDTPLLQLGSVTFWHQSFTLNSNKSPTWCNNFSVYYPDVFFHPNMFRAFFRPSSGAQWLQWLPLVLPSYRGDSRACVRGRANRPDHKHMHGYHHDTKVKPEAATAVIELLMMGGRMPETCWAVNKRQDNKLENCCIWLVIYLNSIKFLLNFCDLQKLSYWMSCICFHRHYQAPNVLKGNSN